MSRNAANSRATVESYAPRFLTRAEAAARLRISLSLLDALIADGRLPVVQLRRRVLVPEASLMDLPAATRHREAGVRG